MGQAFSYPQGPAGTSTTCLEGGKCPIISNAANPGLLALYCFWGFVFILCSIFFLVRHINSKKYKTRELRNNEVSNYGNINKDCKHEIEPLDQSLEPTLTEKTRSCDRDGKLGKVNLKLSEDLASSSQNSLNSDVEVNTKLTPYKNNTIGTCCFYLFNLVSIGWVALFVVINFEKYFGCEMTSIDNLCFFGQYILFGNYEVNGHYAFTIWGCALVWFLLCLIYIDNIRNWFRLPSSMVDVDFMHVWVLYKFEVLDPNESRLVRFIKKIEDFVTSSDLLNGHTTTVQVLQNNDGIKYFIHEGSRYLYDPDSDLFISPKFSCTGKSYQSIIKCKDGLKTSLVNSRLSEFGPNEIPFTPRSIPTLIGSEFSTVFYYYQFLMYSVWIWYSYLFVAAIELTVVILSALLNVFILYSNEHTIMKLTKHFSYVKVLRDGVMVTVCSSELVPGDVIAVEEKCNAPCDLILISGNALVDESSLTGESKPVQKVGCPDDNEKFYYPNKSGSKHSLFAGTKVLQIENINNQPTMALVTATGINTTKGTLISQILFPEKTSFRYEEELKIVFIVLAIYSLAASALAIYLVEQNGSDATWVTMWAYVGCTVSQVMSPLLPVALKVGQIRSCQRLKAKGVFCINPGRIAISGKIRVFCFDKTGTITKDGMDFGGVIPIINCNFDDCIKDVCEPCTPTLIVDALASCHALTKYGGENEIVGNEVEIKMFKAVNWRLNETNDKGVSSVVSPEGKTLNVLRKFEFDHELQTMSVITENENKEKRVYVKGSFEKVKYLCDPATIPSNYDDVAKQYALDGAYVLALAVRDAPDNIQGLKRKEVEDESKFTMLGLMILRNEPKEDSREAILELKNGAVRPVMITGDNAQCGQYISRTCGLVDDNCQILLAEYNSYTEQVTWAYMAINENKQVFTTEEVCAMLDLDNTLELAITGNTTLEKIINSGYMSKLLFNLRIFARMSPESKVLGISLFRQTGLVVGMCGDGGNDCGALRAAQSGIALSDSEASIVSPFTSKSKSIQSVVDLLKEGRASLHTSFAVYKFLIYYGQMYTIIKMVCFYYGAFMCQMSYLFIDAVAVVTLGYTMTLSVTSNSLKTKRPTSSLLGKINMASSIGTFIITFIGLLVVIFITINDKDYVRWPANFSHGANWWELGDNWETTIVYQTMFINLVCQAFVHSYGYKYRQNVFKNWALILNVLALFLLSSLTFLMEPNALSNLWHIASYDFNGPNPSGVWLIYRQNGGKESPGMSFRLRAILWVVILIFVGLSIAWQILVVEGPIGGYFRRKYPSQRIAIRT